MPKIKMDAIEVASSIHKGDFSKLRGKSFEMCDNKNMEKKYTLNQIGDLVVEISKDLKQVNARLDYIVKANDLKDLPKSKKL